MGYLVFGSQKKERIINTFKFLNGEQNYWRPADQQYDYKTYTRRSHKVYQWKEGRTFLFIPGHNLPHVFVSAPRNLKVQVHVIYTGNVVEELTIVLQNLMTKENGIG